MDTFDELREKTNRIVLEGERLLKNGFKDTCGGDKPCASCLAAEARGNDDDIKGNDLGFVYGDVCMLEARHILAEKHDLIIN